MLKLFFLFIYNIFDTLNCSFYSVLNIVSDFFNFCSCFFRRPFFFYFLSPVNLPTPSFTAPLAWSIFSSIDIIVIPFIKMIFNPSYLKKLLILFSQRKMIQQQLQ